MQKWTGVLLGLLLASPTLAEETRSCEQLLEQERGMRATAAEFVAEWYAAQGRPVPEDEAQKAAEETRAAAECKIKKMDKAPGSP